MYVNVLTVDVVAARCVDLYLEQRNQKAASSDKVDIDGRLAAIVERMFERYGYFSALYFVMPTLSEALPFLHNFNWLQPCTVWLRWLWCAPAGVLQMASLSRL